MITINTSQTTHILSGALKHGRFSNNEQTTNKLPTYSPSVATVNTAKQKNLNELDAANNVPA